ncbi:MAG: DNA alkylation repair protein [Bacteroidetes bacterium]|nr:DNA alkylation repair protein [Bacteroidota bacterium]
MEIAEVIDHLKAVSDASRLEGMKRYGINTSKALGVSMPELRALAKTIKKDHQLALELWDTDIHECRILASIIDDHRLVTPQQMDQWVADFDSWDVCDQACGNLFDRTPFAIEKALEYTRSEHEFVKRAGFVLMAEMAVHNKKADDLEFIRLLPIIEREACDERNFVKKAVNWALRQIGKRNSALLPLAIETAKRIRLQNSKAARWIASNALAELEKRT